MDKLRIYSSPASSDTFTEERVFYCQRENGPLYRWSVDERHGQWRYTRVHTPDGKAISLCHSSIKEMPLALQAKLEAHYLH
jgi:hypothetical protein